MISSTRSRLATVAAALLIIFSAVSPGVPHALAASPVVDPGALPKPSPPAPLEPTQQRNACVQTVPAADSPSPTATEKSLNFSSVWPLTRGAGQIVAVIDTGVSPHPRLPGLIGGGDYVASGSVAGDSGSGDSEAGDSGAASSTAAAGAADYGRSDCDAHGTLVAGLIAAHQVPGSGFSGGAPEATIMTIRQSSQEFSATDSKPDTEGQNSSGYGNVMTMAMAIRTAADADASVINISEVACVAAARGIADSALGAAVHYAVHVMNVVVVAAAGNFGSPECAAQNPAPNLLDPTADPWNSVLTIATPAWFDDVLTVGSVGLDGAASTFSLAGPWVDVAAPGTDITSLAPVGSGLTNGTLGSNGAVQAVQGTSFAAPLVSATAALIRAYRPELSALDVVRRIEATAHAPAEGWNPYVGHGVIDPLAAVTADIPAPSSTVQDAKVVLPLGVAASPPDRTAASMALRGLGGVLGIFTIGLVLSIPIRRRIQLAGNAADRSGATPS